MDYLHLLEHSYKQEKLRDLGMSKLEYLADSIFDFTTYDSAMGAFFAQKAVEVCYVINNQKNFEYIENEENYMWYLVMCNMPFFVSKLSWGTSIRGAWWDYEDFEIKGCGLWEGNTQIYLKLNREEWILFINAVIIFSEINNKENHA